MGNAAVSVRKIIMGIPWGDAFMSIGNSENMSTLSLVLPRACYEPTEFSVPLFGRKITNFKINFPQNINKMKAVTN